MVEEREHPPVGELFQLADLDPVLFHLAVEPVEVVRAEDHPHYTERNIEELLSVLDTLLCSRRRPYRGFPPVC